MRCYSLNDGMEMIYDDMGKIIVIRDTKKIQFQNLDEIKHVFHTMTPAFSESVCFGFLGIVTIILIFF